jgi:hypothetical protein
VVAVVQDSGLYVLSVTVTAGNGVTVTAAPPSRLLLPVTQCVNTVNTTVIVTVLVQLELALSCADAGLLKCTKATLKK